MIEKNKKIRLTTAKKTIEQLGEKLIIYKKHERTTTGGLAIWQGDE